MRRRALPHRHRPGADPHPFDQHSVTSTSVSPARSTAVAGIFRAAGRCSSCGCSGSCQSSAGSRRRAVSRTCWKNAINAFQSPGLQAFSFWRQLYSAGDLGVMGAILVLRLHRSCFRDSLLFCCRWSSTVTASSSLLRAKADEATYSAGLYVILFLWVSAAFLDNLASNLLAILHYAAVSVVIILLCNIAALLWLESKIWRSQHRRENYPRWPWPGDRCGCAVWSCSVFLLGLTRAAFLQRDEASRYALIFSCSRRYPIARNNGMSLRQIVLNRRGNDRRRGGYGQFVHSAGCQRLYSRSAVKGAGLAMASGFGWYSLSGIYSTESFGPVIGSAAFFNDLCHELLAIMWSGLIRRSRSTALGLCGATSMDFLPTGAAAFRRRRNRPCRHRRTVFLPVCWSRS